MLMILDILDYFSGNCYGDFRLFEHCYPGWRSSDFGFFRWPRLLMNVKTQMQHHGYR